jgi:Cu/Ag efflux pump CusA
VNMGVRVLAAFVFVFGFAMKVETFPFACLAGWIAMLITEGPLSVRSVLPAFCHLDNDK